MGLALDEQGEGDTLHEEDGMTFVLAPTDFKVLKRFGKIFIDFSENRIFGGFRVRTAFSDCC